MAMPLSPDRPLQAVAADDIGAFVAMAFADPAAWTGREFELAGDERTLPEYAAAISAARGVGVEYVQAPWEAIRERSEDLYRMYDFFEREGYVAHIAALRAEYPRLKSFDAWLDEGGLAGLGKTTLSRTRSSSPGGRPSAPATRRAWTVRRGDISPIGRGDGARGPRIQARI